MTEVAAQYQRRADAFERLVAGTPPDRWTAPSPCDGWTASDVVAHDPATPAEVASYVEWSISFDLPQHGWDLAMATGRDPTTAP